MFVERPRLFTRLVVPQPLLDCGSGGQQWWVGSGGGCLLGHVNSMQEASFRLTKSYLQQISVCKPIRKKYHLSLSD